VGNFKLGIKVSKRTVQKSGVGHHDLAKWISITLVLGGLHADYLRAA